MKVTAMSDQSPVTEWFRPLADKVLLAKLPTEKVTASGIHIPDSAQDGEGGTIRCQVLAVGPGGIYSNGQRVEPSVKAGDIVVVATYAGRNRVKIDGTERIVILESEILGVVEAKT